MKTLTNIFIVAPLAFVGALLLGLAVWIESDRDTAYRALMAVADVADGE